MVSQMVCGGLLKMGKKNLGLRTGGMAQVVEHLFSKLEALCSNLSTIKK
jgi:hypothetical protein